MLVSFQASVPASVFLLIFFFYALKYHFFSFKLYVNFTLILSFFLFGASASVFVFIQYFHLQSMLELQMKVKGKSMKAGREWVCDKVKKDDNWIMIRKMNSVSRKYFFSLKRDINKFCEMCLMLLGWVLHIYMCLSCWKWGEGEIFLFYSGIHSCFKLFYFLSKLISSRK